jgi:hypothetical protein
LRIFCAAHEVADATSKPGTASLRQFGREIENTERVISPVRRMQSRAADLPSTSADEDFAP